MARPVPGAATVRDAIVRGTTLLRRREVPEARLDAELLLAHARGVDRTGLYRDLADPLDRFVRARFLALVRERRRRVPVAYLTGVREFYGLALEVGPGALVPRPETEQLVDAALSRRPADRAWRLLDVGTGSGNIAIAIAVTDPLARVVALETSSRALAFARRNGCAHAVTDRVRWIARDFRTCAQRFRRRFDIVASNPPYVVPDQTALVDELSHEPREALYGADLGFPEIYREISVAALGWLREGGSVLFEVGAGQADEVVAIVRDAGYVDVEVHPDLSGIGRVVAARTRSSV